MTMPSAETRAFPRRLLKGRVSQGGSQDSLRWPLEDHKGTVLCHRLYWLVWPPLLGTGHTACPMLMPQCVPRFRKEGRTGNQEQTDCSSARASFTRVLRRRRKATEQLRRQVPRLTVRRPRIPESEAARARGPDSPEDPRAAAGSAFPAGLGCTGSGPGRGRGAAVHPPWRALSSIVLANKFSNSIDDRRRLRRRRRLLALWAGESGDKAGADRGAASKHRSPDSASGPALGRRSCTCRCCFCFCRGPDHGHHPRRRLWARFRRRRCFVR